MRKVLLSFASTFFCLFFFSSLHAQYNYTTEGFESGWPAAAPSVETSYSVATGTWLNLKSQVITTPKNGTNGISLTAGSNASYIITPLLNSGATTITYWARSSTSTTRNINIYTSTTDAAAASFILATTIASGGTTYVQGSYTFSNPTAIKYIKLSNNGGGGAYIDDVIITTASVSAPTTQASNITFSGVNPTSMTVGLTRGNGSNVAIFVAQGTGAITNPTDGASYTASTTFGGGTQLGSSGYYCIYNGSSASPSATLTGLTPSTTYTVQAFEYNGTGATSKYQTATAANNPSSQATTVAAPTLTPAPSSLSFGGVKTSTTSDKSYSLSGTFLSADGSINVTAPSGYTVSTTSGSGYTSSLYIPYTGTTLSATTIYVRFAPTAQTTYNGNITNVGGGTSATVPVTGTGTLYNVGDYMSTASGNWGSNTTWNKWDGSTWIAASDFPNSQTTDVYITGGFTVKDETSARSVNNLFVTGNSTLVGTSTTATTTSPDYIKIYGSTFSVASGSTVGVTSNSNIYDNISLDVFSTNLTITGGGVIDFSRMRLNPGNTSVTIDNDVTLHYHGSTHGGNATGFFIQAGDNNTLTVNAGKALTFGPWSSMAISGSSHTNGTLALTVNVNGTLAFVDGLVTGNAAVNGWAGHTNGYLSMGVAGKQFNLNIGSTGTVNVSELYPSGTKSDNSPGSGDLTNITVAAGGVLNVSKIADFRNLTQVVTGGGAFDMLTGAVLRIGSPDGITASSALGNIQTAIRGFSTTGVYNYEGSAAQVSGDGLPSTVSGLTINNATGLTLTNNATASDSLTLINGVITTTGKVLTLGTAAIVKGGTNTSYIDGQLTRLTNAASAYAFPVGKAGAYRPVAVIPNSTTASSYTATYSNTGGTGTSCDVTTLQAYAKNEMWDVTKNSGSDAQIQLNYVQANSNGQWTSDGSNTVADPSGTNSIIVAHYNGTCWENVGGTLNGSSASGTITSSAMSSFSPFTFGYSISSSLPVRFTSLKAKQAGTGIEVDFTNATEADVFRYIVERSGNGSNFSAIASFGATSNNGGTASYQTMDAAPIRGINYYRIRCELADGKTIYSSIARINTIGGMTTLSVYPNPVKGADLNVQFSNLPKGNYVLRITGSIGQSVYTENVKHNGGTAVQNIHLGNLSTGVYQLQLVGEGIQLNQPFIKF